MDLKADQIEREDNKQPIIIVLPPALARTWEEHCFVQVQTIEG